MQADFWHERWAKGEIGFHEQDINPLLIAHFPTLSLRKGQRVFVPLCGKTHDISWLLAQGYNVVGAELSEQATIALFESLHIQAEVTAKDGFLLYQAANIDIFVGDIFSLTQALIGQVDGVYDRAALVALPLTMRIRYSQHLINVTDGATQLLICFDYEQSSMQGPPFSVTAAEVTRHYADKYKIESLYSESLAGGLKGRVAALQQVWRLTPG
ncbi:thiopurine S-methyltransferase [Flavobacterium sp. W21_SRS_FM6]|uniref:thiopurine S-methyltransferase n=1 Tax=Flavobacterium sp. W21_SRS_FM6 TaxID=3240268 RepID=UPI003F93C8F8